ncbi:MAG: NADH-quinone oxidoreductase subunit K [Candidatus Ratteibacteria bacterium]|jgi:NADH-quinone oxidoreductase subunit K
MHNLSAFWTIQMGITAFLVFLGLYCLLTMRNLIKLLIGVEIISKGISLAIIATGAEQQSIGLAQSLMITYILAEVIVVATALAIIINIFRHTKTLDIGDLTTLKG